MSAHAAPPIVTRWWPWIIGWSLLAYNAYDLAPRAYSEWDQSWPMAILVCVSQIAVGFYSCLAAYFWRQDLKGLAAVALAACVLGMVGTLVPPFAFDLPRAFAIHAIASVTTFLPPLVVFIALTDWSPKETGKRTPPKR